VPLFLIGTLLLWGLDRAGALDWLTRVGEPLMTGVLGLPASMSGVFIMGFLRRDYGAAGLFTLAQDGALSGVQAVVALTVMTLFVPCIANFLMIVKERGWRVGLAIVGVITPIALLTGAALNHGLRFFGLSF
jgi:ferrous iron transport protein B